MTVRLESLLAEGFVSALDVHAARTWARIAGEECADVIVAAALASRAVATGHVCLDLERVGEISAVLDVRGDGEERGVIDWPDPDPWCALLLASPLVHTDTDARTTAAEAIRPLVLGGGHRLYLRRYWDHQERVAAAIRARMDPAYPIEFDADRLEEGLARLFPVGSEAVDGPDLQRRAAEGALRSRFFVISGGPGTGKTSTVVKILALLVEQAIACNAPLPRIRLLAPTGKATAQMQTSVARSVAGLDCDPRVRAAIPLSATTVHRALGAGGTPTRFRHDAKHPLPADVVLVDEASMIDLALMSRLVSALPPQARLILLGDRDQLASVEAGAVLGDIAGEGGPQEGLDGSRPIIHLLKSHRFDAASALGALVRAVHAGDADLVLELLDDPRCPSVRRIEPEDRDILRTELVAGHIAFAAARSPGDRLAALDRYRVLCAHRHGPFGVAQHNLLVEGLLAAEGAIEPGSEWYAGRPILISHNDYGAGLYNGDLGLVDAPPDQPGAALRVLFRTSDGSERWLSPLRVGSAETVFAMSIHKSQGSEFDAVLVVLPDTPSPIISRELLYTAVSRARSEVCLRASRDVIRDALSKRVERASGLREAIWG